MSSDATVSKWSKEVSFITTSSKIRFLLSNQVIIYFDRIVRRLSKVFEKISEKTDNNLLFLTTIFAVTDWPDLSSYLFLFFRIKAFSS